MQGADGSLQVSTFEGLWRALVEARKSRSPLRCAVITEGASGRPVLWRASAPGLGYWEPRTARSQMSGTAGRASLVSWRNALIMYAASLRQACGAVRWVARATAALSRISSCRSAWRNSGGRLRPSEPGQPVRTTRPWLAGAGQRRCRTRAVAPGADPRDAGATGDELAAGVLELNDQDLPRWSGSAQWDVAQVLSHLGSGAEIAWPPCNPAWPVTGTRSGFQQLRVGSVERHEPIGEGQGFPERRRAAGDRY
jgi:hypothetical protein